MAASVIDLAYLAGRVPVVVKELGICLVERIGQELGFLILEGAGQVFQRYAKARNSPSESQRRYPSCKNCWTCFGAEPPAPVSKRPPPASSGTIESIFALVPSSRIGTGQSSNPSRHFR